MLLLIATYVIPLAVLAVTYTRVGVELWGHQSIGERTPSQIETLKSKRKVHTGGLDGLLCCRQYVIQTPPRGCRPP